MRQNKKPLADQLYEFTELLTKHNNISKPFEKLPIEMQNRISSHDKTFLERELRQAPFYPLAHAPQPNSDTINIFHDPGQTNRKIYSLINATHEGTVLVDSFDLGTLNSDDRIISKDQTRSTLIIQNSQRYILDTVDEYLGKRFSPVFFGKLFPNKKKILVRHPNDTKKTIIPVCLTVALKATLTESTIILDIWVSQPNTQYGVKKYVDSAAAIATILNPELLLYKVLSKLQAIAIAEPSILLPAIRINGNSFLNFQNNTLIQETLEDPKIPAALIKSLEEMLDLNKEFENTKVLNPLRKALLEAVTLKNALDDSDILPSLKKALLNLCNIICLQERNKISIKNKNKPNITVSLMPKKMSHDRHISLSTMDRISIYKAAQKNYNQTTAVLKNSLLTSRLNNLVRTLLSDNSLSSLTALTQESTLTDFLEALLTQTLIKDNTQFDCDIYTHSAATEVKQENEDWPSLLKNVLWSQDTYEKWSDFHADAIIVYHTQRHPQSPSFYIKPTHSTNQIFKWCGHKGSVQPVLKVTPYENGKGFFVGCLSPVNLSGAAEIISRNTSPISSAASSPEGEEKSPISQANQQFEGRSKRP